MVSSTSSPEGQTQGPLCRPPVYSSGGRDLPPAPTPCSRPGSQVLWDIPAPHVWPIQPLSRTQPLLHRARQLAGSRGQEARLGPHPAPITGRRGWAEADQPPPCSRTRPSLSFWAQRPPTPQKTPSPLPATPPHLRATKEAVPTATAKPHAEGWLGSFCHGVEKTRPSLRVHPAAVWPRQDGLEEGTKEAESPSFWSGGGWAERSLAGLASG